MKQHHLVASFLGTLIVVALLGAACAPIPLNPPRVGTPATSPFLPGVDLSPLQPATALAGTIAVAPTAVLTVTTVPTPTASVLTVTPPLVIAGPVWEWVSSTFQDGSVLAPGDPARYTLQLLGDGNALVQADCNFGTGTYEESGNALSFDGIGTTKMACPPDSLDSAFLAQLRNTESYALEGNGLLLSLRNQAGTMKLTAVPTQTPVPLATVVEPPILLGTPVPLPTAVEVRVLHSAATN